MDAGLFVILGLFGVTLLITKKLMEKGTVSLEKYTGQFKNSLDFALVHLQSKYSAKVSIRLAPSGIETCLVYGFLGNAIVRLSEEDILNNGWKNDFNLLARAEELPEIKDSQDMAKFLLYHEYRHHLCNKGKVEKLYVLDLSLEDTKDFPPYFFLPEEYDAHIFALKELRSETNG